MAASTERKRRHHYVWRQYLRAWAQDERVFALINGRIVNPGLMGVAMERDFYEMTPLTPDDVAFVRMLVIEPASPDIRPLHEETLRTYLSAQGALGLAKSQPQLAAMAQAFKSNFVEDWHSATENAGASQLKALSVGDTAFYDDKTSCIDFATFLATQYLRTKRRKADVLRLSGPIPQATVERTWTLLVHMLATNIAWHLFATRTENKLRLLRNPTSTEFITGDQPVLNIAAPSAEGQVMPGTVLFYYPVTPSVAVLLGKPKTNDDPGDFVTTATVKWLNDQIALQAEAQVYATTSEALRPYARGEI